MNVCGRAFQRFGDQPTVYGVRLPIPQRNEKTKFPCSRSRLGIWSSAVSRPASASSANIPNTGRNSRPHLLPCTFRRDGVYIDRQPPSSWSRSYQAKHTSAHRWLSLPRVRRHGANSPSRNSGSGNGCYLFTIPTTCTEAMCGIDQEGKFADPALELIPKVMPGVMLRAENMWNPNAPRGKGQPLSTSHVALYCGNSKLCTCTELVRI